MGCVQGKSAIAKYAVSRISEMQAALARGDVQEVLKITVELWVYYDKLDSVSQKQLDKAVQGMVAAQ
jgi:hypothetical protein